ncbi:MAG: hypothetical protein ACREP9_01735 [Candidatus Dormibacteraceae bacterium]
MLHNCLNVLHNLSVTSGARPKQVPLVPVWLAGQGSSDDPGPAPAGPEYQVVKPLWSLRLS